MTEQPEGDSSEKRYEGLYAEYAFIGSNEDYRHIEMKNCFLRNFGLTGASIYIYQKVPPDVAVFLKLYDPKDDSPIDIMCKVDWVKPAGQAGGPNASKQFDVGLTYINLNDVSMLRLKGAINYLESLAPKKKKGIDYR